MTVPAQAQAPRAVSRRGPQRILVVDDRPTTREILELTLQRVGYRAVGVSGGAEALERLRQERFDLVISDLLMPGMSGIELLVEIRKHFPRTELPVVILTVKEEGDDLVAAMRCGASDYVTKPIRYPILLARVEAQLALCESLVGPSPEVAEELGVPGRSGSPAPGQGDSLGCEVLGALSKPLRALRDLASDLVERRGERLEPAFRGGLDEVRTGLGHVHRLVADLAELQSALAGAGLHERVDLARLADEAWRRRAGNREGAHVVLATGTDLEVEGDPRLLGRIVLLLLDRARGSAARRDGGRVELGATVRDGVPVFFVADNGRGGERPEDRAAGGADSTTGGRDLGLPGLELALAEHLVRRHGGRLWTEDHRGEGERTCFTLEHGL